MCASHFAKRMCCFRAQVKSGGKTKKEREWMSTRDIVLCKQKTRSTPQTHAFGRRYAMRLPAFEPSRKQKKERCCVDARGGGLCEQKTISTGKTLRVLPPVPDAADPFRAQVKSGGKTKKERECVPFFVSPPAGLEPATPRLTAACSAN